MFKLFEQMFEVDVPVWIGWLLTSSFTIKLFSSAVPSGCGAFQMPTHPSSASILRGRGLRGAGRANSETLQ